MNGSYQNKSSKEGTRKRKHVFVDEDLPGDKVEPSVLSDIITQALKIFF